MSALSGNGSTSDPWLVTVDQQLPSGFHYRMRPAGGASSSPDGPDIVDGSGPVPT